MRVFLTGATGYLGGAVAQALREKGHDIVMLVRRTGGDASLEDRACTLVYGNLETPGEWAGQLQGCHAVVHTAAAVGAWGHAKQFNDINIQASLNLLDHALEADISRIIMTGSLFALGPSPGRETLAEDVLQAQPGLVSQANHYVRSKTEISRRLFDLQQTGNPVIQVFPTILVGPGKLTPGNHLAKVLGDIGRNKFPGMIGSGNQIWNIVGVADAAAGHVLAMERGTLGENYILGGENWSQRQLVERSAVLLGVEPPQRTLGTRLPHIAAQLFESWAKFTGKEPLLTHGEIDLYNQNWSFTSKKAQQDLGYSTRSVDAVLRDTVAWLRQTVWTS